MTARGKGKCGLTNYTPRSDHAIHSPHSWPRFDPDNLERKSQLQDFGSLGRPRKSIALQDSCGLPGFALFNPMEQVWC